jgi:hypothetical protein
MKKLRGQKTNKHLLAQKYYSSIAICRTKIPATIERDAGSFRGLLKFVCIYSTISREIPDDILPNPGRKPGWETLHYSDYAIVLCSYTN